MRTLICIAIAASLAGCARGGGVGLEAVVADGLCEQQGFRLGTPEYRSCRAQVHYQQGVAGAAYLASQQRLIEKSMEQANRRQTCLYGGGMINCW